MSIRRRQLRAAGIAMLVGLCIAADADTGTAVAQTKLVFANASPYDTLDPHMVLDSGRIASRINLYDGLFRWVDNPAKLELWLAEKYTVSPDGFKHSFDLRKGAKFHDGSEIKAADVVYSMERLLALKQGAFPLFAVLVAPGSTRATGEHAVEFNLIKPSPIFVSILAEMYVVNPALIKKNEINNDWGSAWLAKNDAGSGSFKLTSFDPAKGFSAERFKEHWNQKWAAKPIDEIEFRTVVDPNARVEGLVNGTIHATDGYLPPDKVKRLRETPHVSVQEAESLRVFYALLHNGREPTNDLNFRKALSHAFDYEGFIKGTLAGSAVRNPTPIPNGFWGAPKGFKGNTYDPPLAAEYLAKMKSPPREITIAALAGYPQTQLAAAQFQTNLEKIGIKSKLVTETWPVVSAKTRDEKQMYDVLFAWKSAHYLDPANWIGEMYDCDQIGGRNSSWYCNREVDKFLKEGLNSSDVDARRKAYEKAATLLVEDAAGIFVHTTKWYGPLNKRVSGLRYCPVSDGQDMRWASMEPLAQ